MKTQQLEQQINFRKHPYRGVITEMSKELECTPQQVWNSINITGTPSVLRMLAQKINQRNKDINKSKSIVNKYANN